MPCVYGNHRDEHEVTIEELKAGEPYTYESEVKIENSRNVSWCLKQRKQLNWHLKSETLKQIKY